MRQSIIAVCMVLIVGCLPPTRTVFSYDESVQSIVHIEYANSQGGMSKGSGFYIGNGRVLTANHVPRVETVDVITHTGTTTKGKVVERFADIDLAVIQLESDTGLRAVVFAQSVPSIGERLYTIGSPFGYRFSYGQGYVMNPVVTLEQEAENAHILVDIGRTFGSSGSPVFDVSGEVIGVLTTAFQHSNLTILTSIRAYCERAQCQ